MVYILGVLGEGLKVYGFKGLKGVVERD